MLVLVGTSGVFVSSVIMILPVAEVDLAALCCMQHMLPYTALALAYAALITKALHIRVQQAVDTTSQVCRIHAAVLPRRYVGYTLRWCYLLVNPLSPDAT